MLFSLDLVQDQLEPISNQNVREFQDQSQNQNQPPNVLDFPGLVSLLKDQSNSLKEQSKLILSLHKIIENLNARLERFEVNEVNEKANLSELEHTKTVHEKSHSQLHSASSAALTNAGGNLPHKFSGPQK